MLIQLPNGLIDGMDHYGYAEIDELRGKQQNYLANQELVVGNIGHIPKILEDMVLSLQTKEGLKWQGKISEAIWKLPSSDIETILIKIRENTYGSKFYHGAECTHCKNKMKDLKLELSELEIKVFPVSEMMSSKSVTLPKSKHVAELKPSYLRDIFDMIKIISKNKDTIITSLIPLSIKNIKTADGKVISPVKSDFVEDLPVSDLIFLQEETGKVTLEGSIDTDIEIECSECHEDFTLKLNVFDSNFFDPTKVSTSGNT